MILWTTEVTYWLGSDRDEYLASWIADQWRELNLDEGILCKMHRILAGFNFISRFELKATTCFLIFPTMMPQIFLKFLTRLEMKFGEVIIRRREWMIPTSSIHLMLIQSLGLFEVEMRTGFQFIHMKIFNPLPADILRF